MISLINELARNGFITIPEIYTPSEIQQILDRIDQIEINKPTFRKSTDLFAIRQFLNEIPATLPLIFNERLKNVITTMFGADYFIAKSIYFDKPEHSNWFVAYHQDLTISVDRKLVIENYGPWTVKQNQFAVQPPINILENNFTIRIHLDDTDENNGALKVIPTSHLKGIYKAENINWDIEKEQICNVKKGAIMIMKPLLLHGSNKTTNHKKRRVIHIEFATESLSYPLQWSEKQMIPHENN